jgi:hypothetical protein
MQTSYVYKWVHKPSYKWYVGSRTAKNASLDDGYICSSKTVKPLILANPQDWEKKIIAFGLPKDMRALEATILEMFDAANDLRSFNKNNQNGTFVCHGHSEETKKKIALDHLGKKRPKHSETMRGKKRKPEDIKKWADKMRGRPLTENHKKALTKSFRKWIYETPNGVFESSREAALANNCSKSSVLQRCKGYYARGIWHQPIAEWYCKQKD